MECLHLNIFFYGDSCGFWIVVFRKLVSLNKMCTSCKRSHQISWWMGKGSHQMLLMSAVACTADPAYDNVPSMPSHPLQDHEYNASTAFLVVRWRWGDAHLIITYTWWMLEMGEHDSHGRNQFFFIRRGQSINNKRLNLILI